MKQPLNIGQEINSEGNESEIMLKKDGKTAYRSEWNKDKKNYDLVTYSLPEKCRAKAVHLINLNVIDKTIVADWNIIYGHIIFNFSERKSKVIRKTLNQSFPIINYVLIIFLVNSVISPR